MPVISVLRAKHEFSDSGPEGERLMALKEGDIVFLLFKHESGWGKGRKESGEKGWFPLDFCEEVGNASDIPQDGESSPRKTSSEQDEAFKREKLLQLSPTETRRYNTIFEMYTTEKSYQNSLQKIIRLYLNPIRDGNAPIEPKYVPKIFANIEEIQGVSAQFLSELEAIVKAWKDGDTVGQLWVTLIPKLDIYLGYMKNHHTTIITINNLVEKKVVSTWLNAQKEESNGLDILAFLIMPVQRILRYKLLLEDLLKNTPDTHEDYENLSKSLENILALAFSVNESMKAEENFKKLIQIQKSFVGNVKEIVAENRTFIMEGPLYKVCRKSSKFRWVFLFSDALVYASFVVGTGSKNNKQLRKTASTAMTRPDNDSSLVPKHLFHRIIYLNNMQIKDMEDTETQKNAFQIITTEDKSFTVFAETPEEKAKWIKHLTKLTSSTNLEETAPVWLPDSTTKKCMLCPKTFNVVQRRHHCRYCGMVVCGSCSAQSITIPHISSKPVRVCKKCFEALSDPNTPGTSRPVSVRHPPNTISRGNTESSSEYYPPVATPPSPVPTSPTTA
eukprot:TRINITY_DN2376_c0_g1_i1.p1 TRINITY_DN2376_c0_g1~~TRINITY_DN2376_c0_g1_i1.p1  ORF type:complete len:623 (+),score=229.58 TRINITY_DN2376_c0_g1_i1:195-1871(+)